MAKDLNKVQLTGYLGADPEMRFTAQGSAVTTFRVASGRTWKDRDGNQRDDTEWFRVVSWDKLAEICNQYLTKGTRVYVEGRLQTRKWTDRDGNDRYTTEVICQDMIILSSRSERNNASMPDSAGAYNDADQDAGYDMENTPPSNGRSRSVNSRAPAARPAPRNQPQSINDDDDIPF